MINYVLGVVLKQFLIHLYIQHDTIDACAVYCAMLPSPVPAQN